jgi:2-desacetyl-2-hydroxyethyl bacteriochlorophyllide A dehydrogenase
LQSTYIEFPEKDRVTVRTESIDTANLGPLDVIVRNEASVISTGTELALLQGIEPGVGFPCRPGYAAVGRVLAMSDGVTGRQVGDRVFYYGRHASVQKFTHGGGSQWTHLFPVPERIASIDAPMACMAQIAMSAPNITDLAMGDTVAVFGLGLVGILAAQLYAIRGARVIGVDPLASRCELAARVGIADVVNAAPDRQVAALMELTGGTGPRVAVDATGLSPVIGACARAAAKYGQVILLGSPRAPHTANVTDLVWDIHIKSLTVRGAHAVRYPLDEAENIRFTVQWAVGLAYSLMLEGRLKVRELISHVIKPDAVLEAYEGLRRDPSKYTGVMIDWSSVHD